MVPYKKIPAIVAAFAQLPDKKLVVIGDGTEMKRVKATAGRNVEVLGYQPTDVVRDYMQRAKAMVFAAEEDFGIGPVEAQACGTPVIAFGRGGALETIRGIGSPNPSGLFFNSQEPTAIAAAVEEFDRHSDTILPSACRDSALRFSIGNFRRDYSDFVGECWEKFQAPRKLA
jgi:glycosyltransferase involved in cell wall biosynthesis